MSYPILLVDDEEGLRKVLGLSLEDRGYEVHTAKNGQEALAVYKDLTPPIVLTDIKMPGMDGIDLLKEIKRLDENAEIIMITGHGDIELAIKSLKFDATDFITKPIDDDILDIALKRAQERLTLRRQLRDYTENLEQLVEEKSRQLVRAERLAAMGETVAGLSHAIKNISGGLKGGVFVLEKGIDLDNPTYLKEGWQMVRDNVDRIQQLSIDLLNIAKPGVPKFEPTDPNLPLRQVYDLIRPQAKQYGILLTFEPDKRLRPVTLDRELIYRCLLNLVTNAMDACLYGGEGNDGAKISLVSKAAFDCIEYHVIDNCGGMEEAVQEKIFNAFFTTKGSRGTGIGLMLTRKIIEAHGGQVTVSSQKDQGSQFVIRLPKAISSRGFA